MMKKQDFSPISGHFEKLYIIYLYQWLVDRLAFGVLTKLSNYHELRFDSSEPLLLQVNRLSP